MRFTRTLATALVAIAALVMVSKAHALAVTTSFDPSGTGSFDASNVITNIDWERGNVLATEVVPIAGAGDEFEVYYHAQLSIFGGPNGLALAAELGITEGLEMTVVAGYRERVASVTPTGAPMEATVTFELLDHPDNFFEIWVGAPDSDEAAGTGYNNGTMILSARPNFGAPSGNNFTADLGTLNDLASNNGQQSVTGGGSLNVFAEIESYDSDWLQFDPSMSSTIILTAFTDGNLNLFPEPADFAFANTMASDSFWTGAGFHAADLGTINGLDGPDFQFTADAATSFVASEIPEPMSASLGLIGLGGLLLGVRRRRNA